MNPPVRAHDGAVRRLVSWQIVSLAGGVLVLAACGSTSSPGPLHPTTPGVVISTSGTPSATPLATSTPGLPPGLLASTSSYAEFLQLIQTGSQISGTETYYDYEPSDTGHLAQGVDDVSGFISGTQVQLTIGSGTFTGVLDPDGSLALSVTQSDGSIGIEQFVPATIDEYNQALGSIQALLQEWNLSYWVPSTSLSCTLADGSHDVRVFVAEGGGAICSQAVADGYTEVTTYVTTDTVVCFNNDQNGVALAVADDGGQALASDICPSVNAGDFPTASAPSY